MFFFWLMMIVLGCLGFVAIAIFAMIGTMKKSTITLSALCSSAFVGGAIYQAAAQIPDESASSATWIFIAVTVGVAACSGGILLLLNVFMESWSKTH